MSRFSTWCLACLLLVPCCTPATSTVPLGEGPLAVAEAQRTAKARALEREKKLAAASADSSEAARQSAPPPIEAKSKKKPTPPVTKATKPATRTASNETDGGAPSDTPGGVAAFLGDYRGEDSSVYALAGMPNRTEKDPNARTRVDDDGENHIDIALVDSSNGSDICVLRAEVKGTRATLEPGAPCFEQSTANVEVGAPVESGTATIKEDRLVLDILLSMEMKLGARTVEGTLTYHFTGTRQ